MTYSGKRRLFKTLRVLSLIFGILMVVGGGYESYGLYNSFQKAQDTFFEEQRNVITAGIAGMMVVIGITLIILSFALFRRKQIQAEKQMGLR